MVPAHHVVTLRLVGCPDPAPSYVRTFTPARNVLPRDLGEIGRLYIGALSDEIAKWLETVPANEPVGVCFSGGIDSGAVFLVTHHVLRRLGMSPARLKAFTLSLGSGPLVEGPDLAQARAFLDSLDFGFFLEHIDVDPEPLSPQPTTGWAGASAAPKRRPAAIAVSPYICVLVIVDSPFSTLLHPWVPGLRLWARGTGVHRSGFV